MARTKQTAPLQRVPSDFGDGPDPSQRDWKSGTEALLKQSNAELKKAIAPVVRPEKSNDIVALVVCVGGIYASL
jgi:hypothetical protein